MILNCEKYKEYVQTANKPIAFVLNLSENGLGVIRSLGRRSIPVIGLDPNPWQIGLFSKYCKGMVCPDPESDEEEYIEFLLKIGELLRNKGVLIPSADIELRTILNHKKELERYYLFPIADSDVANLLANKRLFYEIVENLGFPCPKTFFPHNKSDLQEICNKIKFPCIIKPIFSTKFNRDFGVKVFVADTLDDLILSFDKAVSNGLEVLIQEIIPGNDSDMYLVSGYFDRFSEPLGIFTFKRIRQYPLGFGNGALCLSIWRPEIADLCTSFLKLIKYHGLVDAELKKDPRDNKFKFIEINPRTGLQHMLSARCGIDLPYLAYRDTIGEKPAKITSQTEGIKWLHMFNDIRSAFDNMRLGRLSFLEYLDSLRGEKEYAIFALDDLLPFIMHILNKSYYITEFLIIYLINVIRSY